MFCNKCGEQIEDTAKFCNKCGNETNNIGSITFERQKQYYGCLVPVKVFMDGQQVATLTSGQQATIQTTIGKHQVNFNLWSGNGAEEVTLESQNPNIKVTFKVGMGVVTSKPKIVKIENI